MSAFTFTKVHHDGRDDEVAVEEPLEIRVDGEPARDHDEDAGP